MKKLSILIIIILGFAITMNAQPYGGKLKASQKLKIADEQLEIGDYYNALEWYNKVLEETPNNLTVISKVAEVHYLLRDFKSAQSWYEKLVKNDKSDQYTEAAFHLGRILKMNGELANAKSTLEGFIGKSDNATLKTLATSELAGIALFNNMGDNLDITVSDAGENINSPYTDFSPIYGAEGEMYYGALVSEEVIVLDGSTTDYFAKIYFATKSGDSWTKGTQLDNTINRPGVHTGNVTLSPDGNTMYFTRSALTSNKITASSLYRSEKSADGWGTAYPVEGLGDHIIKHPTVGEAFGSPALFFSSDMAGGQGGWDIYYAPINGDKLGAAVNVGNTINTVGDELTPSYSDGMLYFSSTGHPGIGGLDVFSSKWTGSWNNPVNMGKEINSSYDDIYFSLNPAGFNGFVVSNRPSDRSLKSKTCCDDIYDVTIKEVILDLEALAFTSEGNKPLNGVSVQLIEMLDGSEGKTETEAQASNHKFGFPLAREMAYKIIASKKGYKDAVVTFNTVGLGESQTIKKDLTLEFIPVEPTIVEVTVYDTIKSQQPFRLNNILYDFNKSTIRTDAEQDLQLVLGYMQSYPDLVIEMGSHTDAIGKTGVNQRLSQRRAESAKKWLVEKGIAPTRIQAVGYGESLPIAENTNADGSDNPEGRQLNRRTEFKIIGGPKFIVTQRVEKRVVKKTVN